MYAFGLSNSIASSTGNLILKGDPAQNNYTETKPVIKYLHVFCSAYTTFYWGFFI